MALTYVTVSYENELTMKIDEMKTELISCPIDLCIAVIIPIRLLTQSVIRNCKIEKVPAVFVDPQNLYELEKIPWESIRESEYPFNSPLIPITSSTQKEEVENDLSKWKSIMKKEKIPDVFEVLHENQALSAKVLNKSGFAKSYLMCGTEVSYNLYINAKEIKKVEEVNLFHYYGDRLIVTVHKGNGVRSGAEFLKT
ncbi:MAG: hypothetical protein K6T88_09575 [Bacillus sp. (in: Bacteria)]|nr:hypothetical protein [Bacillus sp. (in: firmicutes)]